MHDGHGHSPTSRDFWTNQFLSTYSLSHKPAVIASLDSPWSRQQQFESNMMPTRTIYNPMSTVATILDWMNKTP